MRSSLRLLAAAVVAVLVTAAAPVVAEEPDEGDSGPPPTVPDPDGPAPAPTTTVPATTVPPTTSTSKPAPTTTVPFSPPEHEDQADVDDVPTGVTVPTAPRHVPVVPGNRAVVASFLAEAKSRLAVASEELSAVTGALVEAEGPLRAAEAELARLSRTEQVAAEQIIAVREQMQARAVGAFVRIGVDTRTEALLTSRDPNQLARRQTLVDVVAAYDVELLGAYETIRAEASSRVADLADEISDLRARHDLAVAAFDAAASELVAAEVAVAVAEVDSPIAVDGFTFPVEPPYSFISSYGFCRDGCRRSHQGNDIFAPMGNDIYAVERGVITKMGTGKLGGIRLWLVGESGTRYYYAHLSGFAPGITDGTVVEIGQVIGYVGDTGNAKGTSPHLHFEIHPAGMRAAIDPYPLLRAAADADAEHRAQTSARPGGSSPGAG